MNWTETYRCGEKRKLDPGCSPIHTSLADINTNTNTNTDTNTDTDNIQIQIQIQITNTETNTDINTETNTDTNTKTNTDTCVVRKRELDPCCSPIPTSLAKPLSPFANQRIFNIYVSDLIWFHNTYFCERNSKVRLAFATWLQWRHNSDDRYDFITCVFDLYIWSRGLLGPFLLTQSIPLYRIYLLALQVILWRSQYFHTYCQTVEKSQTNACDYASSQAGETYSGERSDNPLSTSRAELFSSVAKKWFLTLFCFFITGSVPDCP